MTVENVVILCQGQQTRLPKLSRPKHLLALPGTASPGGPPETSLGRTLRLVRARLPDAKINVVGGPKIVDALRPALVRDPDLIVTTLSNPGNSVLTGLDRLRASMFPFRSCAILLGDVVWSQDALGRLLRDERPLVFAGTLDISGSGGEIFGISCHHGPDSPRGVGYFLRLLESALLENPRVDTYQAGQLRRILWAYQRDRGVEFEQKLSSYYGEYYLPVTDWTKDIDTPEDLERLPELAAKCVEEDAALAALFAPNRA